MNELSFNLTTPIKLYPGSKNLEFLVNCIVAGMSLEKAISHMMQKLCPNICNLFVNNIEDEQKILDWLRPFVLKEKENKLQRLVEEIENTKDSIECASDDLKRLRDEFKQLENLEI